MPRAISLLALALFATACSGAGDNRQQIANGAVAAPSMTDEPPAVVVATASGSNCAFTLNGQPVTREALRAQSVTLIGGVMREPGGTARMTDKNRPAARLEGAANLPYDCAAFALGDLQAAGFAWVTLRVPGAGDRRVSVFNSHNGPYSPRAIVQMGTGARIAWAEEEIDLTALRQRTVALQGSAVTPDDFVLVPAADTDFGAVHRAVGVVRDIGVELYLSGCPRLTGTDPRYHSVWGSERPVSRC